MMWRALISVCLLCWGSLSAHASTPLSDWSREQLFAQEIEAQLILGDLVRLPLPGSTRTFAALYAAGNTAQPAILLAHGVGTHPDDGLTGTLRKRLHDLGYTTLAIQMPIAAKEAQVQDYFPRLFPSAGERLRLAAAWLRERGHARIVLVGHTMGAWMSQVHLDELHRSSAPLPYQAWVCITLTGSFSNATRDYRLPVLDLYGEQDIPVSVSAAGRRASVLRIVGQGSRQLMVEAADAQWRGRESQAAQAIDAFIRDTLK
jgi:hypothetical protein